MPKVTYSVHFKNYNSPWGRWGPTSPNAVRTPCIVLTSDADVAATRAMLEALLFKFGDDSSQRVVGKVPGFRGVLYCAEGSISHDEDEHMREANERIGARASQIISYASRRDPLPEIRAAWLEHIVLKPVVDYTSWGDINEPSPGTPG